MWTKEATARGSPGNLPNGVHYNPKSMMMFIAGDDPKLDTVVWSMARQFQNPWDELHGSTSRDDRPEVEKLWPMFTTDLPSRDGAGISPRNVDLILAETLREAAAAEVVE